MKKDLPGFGKPGGVPGQSGVRFAVCIESTLSRVRMGDRDFLAVKLGDDKLAGQQPLVDHFYFALFPKDCAPNPPP